MLKLKLQYFGHLMRRTDSLEKTLMLGKIEGRRRRGDDGGWDGWMALPTRWTRAWASSGSWWWTGKPDVLHSMGLQRVGHDWAAELKWWQCSGPRSTLWAASLQETLPPITCFTCSGPLQITSCDSGTDLWTFKLLPSLSGHTLPSGLGLNHMNLFPTGLLWTITDVAQVLGQPKPFLVPSWEISS